MFSNRTLARKMATLRNFFGYMADKEYIAENPTLKAGKNQKYEENDIKRLDVDEVKRLIKAVEETKTSTKRSSARSKNTAKRDLATVILLLNLGLCVSECAGLDLNDVNTTVKHYAAVDEEHRKSVANYDLLVMIKMNSQGTESESIRYQKAQTSVV